MLWPLMQVNLALMLLMKPRSRHISTKKGFIIFFTVTLWPFIKCPYFPSRNITKNAETHPPSMRDVIIEQSLTPSFLRVNFPFLSLLFPKHSYRNSFVW